MTPRGPTHAFTPPASNVCELQNIQMETSLNLSVNSISLNVTPCDNAVFKALPNKGNTTKF